MNETINLVVILKRIGIREDYTVLDFGCGEGTYTIPVALIVGERGRVYALDKDEYSLNILRLKIRERKLSNIVVLKSSGGLEISLGDGSVDVVLLFDVLHSWYFPRSRERLILLGEIYRVLKNSGCLLFYPGDPEIYSNYEELDEILKDIRWAGFIETQFFYEKILHERTPVYGHIYKFKKLKNMI